MRISLSLFFIAFLTLSGPVFAATSVQSDVNLWLVLRDNGKEIDFNTVSGFLARRPTWPQADFIRTRAEHALLDAHASDGQILNWFKGSKPRTDRGRLAYWQALRNAGRGVEADTYARAQFRDGAFNKDQYYTLLSFAPKLFAYDDYRARFSTLMWQGNRDRTEDSLRFAPDDLKDLARARIQLQRFGTLGPGMANVVPRSVRNDDGLLWDRVRYARQKNDDDLAIKLLQQHAGGNANSKLWWRERSILIRRAMDEKNYKRAYQLAAGHGFTEGGDYAEAEWLAGWLATTRLHQPQQGLRHFEKMFASVQSAISRARGAYWAGVAADAAGQHATADVWFGKAAQHMHTFYGQMAAYALGNPKASYQAFVKRSQTPHGEVPSDLAAAARILHELHRENERDAFLRAALTVLNEKGQPQALIPLAQKLDSPEMALIAAKAAYDKGILVKDALLPHVTVPKRDDVEKALTLAIIRQESQFDRFALSPAKAMGLMQVLPGTAAMTARKEGIVHSGAAQLYNPTHNMQLGQAYLAGLLNRYNGFLPLAIAAYNAGPGNVDKWIATMGDPRENPDAWVDWVERIPFYETRNYVQRVWEAYSIYKYMN